MKKRFGILFVSSALMLSSAALMAQPYGHDHDKDHGHSDQHHGNPHYDGMHDRGRHEGWYKKGGHMPEEYRGGRYVVTDWHRDHLREPPRGYNWVRSDTGDFLLVAVATGVITDLILNH